MGRIAAAGRAALTPAGTLSSDRLIALEGIEDPAEHRRRVV
jgi:hypothetical protein